MRYALIAPSFLLFVSTAPLAAQQPPAPPLPAIAPAQARLDQTIGGLDGPGHAVAVGEEGGFVAAGTEHGTVQCWARDVLLGLRAGQGSSETFKAHQGPVLDMAWRGGVLASAGADHKVTLWQMPEGKPLSTLQPEGGVRSLALSPDGKLLATGGDDNAIQLWDVAAGKPGAKLAGHTDWVMALAFSPDGKQLASGGYDGVVRLWDVAGTKKVLDVPAVGPPQANQPPPTPGRVLSLAFAPDGKQLAVGTADAQLLLFNLADGKLLRPFAGHTGPVTGLAFHPSGTVLASASRDRTVKLWTPTNGQLIKSLDGHTSWVQGVAFAAQGTRLVSVGADQSLRVWDLSDPMKK